MGPAAMSPSPRIAARAIGFRPAEISSLINRPVVEAHAGEAAFLWTQRTRVVSAPHYRLKHLRKIDGRVLAHLVGLRIAGDAGWHAAQEALAGLDGATLFVAAHVAFGRRDARQMYHVLQLALTKRALTEALLSALEWLEPAALRPALDRLCASSHPEHRRLGLAALAAHRLLGDEALVRAAEDADPEQRGIALKAVAQASRDTDAALSRDAINDPDEVCRFWAACSLALRGEQPGAVVALQTGMRIAPLRRLAIDVALRCGDRGWALDTVRLWAATPGKLRDTIHAMAALGDPAAIPWLLERMGDPMQRRAAGEALSTITGVDLRYSDLTADAAEDEATDPEDIFLPVPDPGKIRDWWQAQRPMFRNGAHYLAGNPVDAAAAQQTLRDGYQRQRAAAAIELAHAGKVALFPVTARADRQHRWLAS
jgi:uncharacterized protein (TIGR02270 family)